MRHSDVVIRTMPDLFVSVKAARGGDWPGRRLLTGELAAVAPEAIGYNSLTLTGSLSLCLSLFGVAGGRNPQESPVAMWLSVLLFTVV